MSDEAEPTPEELDAVKARVLPPKRRIRPMVAKDLPAVGVLAGELVRLHHRTDPRRFLLVEDVERGYAGFFRSQLGREDVVLLVAEHENSEIKGYAYATLEGRDWNLLLDAHGAIHDVCVVEAARGAGIGEALMRAVCETLEKQGAQRIVLSTMVANTAAQALFAKLGFRATMTEMTRG